MLRTRKGRGKSSVILILGIRIEAELGVPVNNKENSLLGILEHLSEAGGRLRVYENDR